MGLRTVPVTLAQARDFVAAWHRHRRPQVGYKFSIRVADDAGLLVGVAIVGAAGRPVPRRRRDLTCSPTCYLLFTAAWHAAKALGHLPPFLRWLTTVNQPATPPTANQPTRPEGAHHHG